MNYEDPHSERGSSDEFLAGEPSVGQEGVASAIRQGAHDNLLGFDSPSALSGDQNDGAATRPADSPEELLAAFDYTYVTTTARIAVYDDLRSAPRVTEIKPAETATYIEALASTVYNQARQAGGAVPYTVIKEVSENFIHARFKEIVVSVLDHGCTIRFADQGPGIAHKEKAQLPGFSSAIEPMKKYIRGVGSGLPLVKDYLEFSHGSITIEDNMGAGAVVTISMTQPESTSPAESKNPLPTVAGSGWVQDGGIEGEGWLTQQDPHHVQSVDYGAAAARFPRQEIDRVYAPAPNAFPPGPYAGPQEASSASKGTFASSAAMTTPQVSGLESARSAAYGGSMADIYPAAYQNPGYPTQGAYPAYGNAGSFAYYDPARATQSNLAHEAARVQMALAPLSQKERDFLPILLTEGAMGVTDMKDILEMPASSIHGIFKKLEQAGLVEQQGDKKRDLTPLGREVAAYVYSL